MAHSYDSAVVYCSPLLLVRKEINPILPHAKEGGILGSVNTRDGCFYFIERQTIPQTLNQLHLRLKDGIKFQFLIVEF